MILYKCTPAKWFLLVVFLGISHVLIAAKTKNRQGVLTLEAPGGLVFQFGGYSGIAGKSQHININGAIGDQYNVTNHNSFNVILGMGYYTKSHLIGSHAFQYGLNAFYLNDMTVNGTINQENLFTNLSYYYNLKHLPIYAMFKMPLLYKSPPIALTADIGIGPNVIFLSRVDEQSLDGGVTLPDNAFGRQTDVAFSATVGFNVQFLQLDSGAVSCGYRFFYLGDASFKKNTDQLSNTLTTGPSYANALMCQMML